MRFEHIPTPFKGGGPAHGTFYIVRTNGILPIKTQSHFLLGQCLANHQEFQQPYFNIIGTTRPTSLEKTSIFIMDIQDQEFNVSKIFFYICFYFMVYQLSKFSFSSW